MVMTHFLRSATATYIASPTKLLFFCKSPSYAVERVFLLRGCRLRCVTLGARIADRMQAMLAAYRVKWSTIATYTPR